jgi:hypothetical protein
MFASSTKVFTRVRVSRWRRKDCGLGRSRLGGTEAGARAAGVRHCTQRAGSRPVAVRPVDRADRFRSGRSATRRAPRSTGFGPFRASRKPLPRRDDPSVASARRWSAPSS